MASISFFLLLFLSLLLLLLFISHNLNTNVSENGKNCACLALLAKRENAVSVNNNNNTTKKVSASKETKSMPKKSDGSHAGHGKNTSSVKNISLLPLRLTNGSKVVKSGKGRPNILFILTDDQSEIMMDYMYNLQKYMQSEGTMFNQYIYSNSECAPSRVTMLTGRHGNNHGVTSVSMFPGWHANAWSIFHSRGGENKTIATILSKIGYRTHISGKYVNGFAKIYNSSNESHHNLISDISDTYIPPGWTDFHAGLRETGYHGFDYHMQENGEHHFYGKKIEDYNGDVITGKVTNFISNHVKHHSHKPFFAIASYLIPHYPAVPAPRHSHLLKNVYLPKSPNFNQHNTTFAANRLHKICKLLNHTEIDNVMEVAQNMTRCTLTLDDYIKQIYDTLESLNITNNTYVFFASDNGQVLGNHRIMRGKCSPYEENLIGRLYVTGPNIPKNYISNQLVGNMDLFSTWLDIAMTDREYSFTSKQISFDGMSLMPLMDADVVRNSNLKSKNHDNDDKNDSIDNQNNNTETESKWKWRQVYFIEHGIDEPYEKDNLTKETCIVSNTYMVRYEGLRTSRYTFVQYVDDDLELYDIIDDPYQLLNLARLTENTFECHINFFKKGLKKMRECAGNTCRDDWVKSFADNLHNSCGTPTITDTMIGEMSSNSNYVNDVLEFQANAPKPLNLEILHHH